MAVGGGNANPSSTRSMVPCAVADRLSGPVTAPPGIQSSSAATARVPRASTSERARRGAGGPVLVAARAGAANATRASTRAVRPVQSTRRSASRRMASASRMLLTVA